MEICQKILTPHAPPFKVTQASLEPTRIDHLGPTYDFLFDHSNYSPIVPFPR